MSYDTRIYSSRPILISASCKRETGTEHASVLDTVISACKKKTNLIKGRMLSIASDGESRRGIALAQLTMISTLTESSPIYHMLRNLEFMNFLVGADDLTADKDYKHVLKRCRSFIIRKSGTLINDFLINRSIIRTHLISNGMHGYKADELLNPDDRQDVTLMYQLLKAIWELPPPLATLGPVFSAARLALNILGRFLFHLAMPYIDIHLTLRDQLQHLSTAAHMALVLYTRNHNGTKFMPSQLYGDLMTMIKNAYFCVAKVKATFPNKDYNFYLIHLGTDRLEVSFGILRTMIGNDCNTDVLQLSTRLSNVVECANILAAHPEWDRGPRRLHLPPIASPDGISQKVDHINPATWVGDVNVKNITLATSWKRGRTAAEIIIMNAEGDLQNLHSQVGIDILQPFGVLVVGNDMQMESGEDEADADADRNGNGNGGRVNINSEDGHKDRDNTATIPTRSNMTDAMEYDEDFEELVTSSIDLVANSGNQNDQSPPLTSPAYDPYLTVNSKKMYKGRLLKIHLTTKPGSADRKRRIAGSGKYDESASVQTNVIVGESILGAGLFINDPAITLVQCAERIFLAVIQVSEILVESQSIASIVEEELSDRHVGIQFQILKLARTDTEAEGDWLWKSAFGTTLFRTEGRFIFPIDPTIVVKDLQPCYVFKSESLLQIASTLFSNLGLEALQSLPTVVATDFFPYRTGGQVDSLLN